MSTTFIIYPTTPVASVGRKLHAVFMIRAFSHFLGAVLAVLALQAIFFAMGWAGILAGYVKGVANGSLYALAAVPVVGWTATRFARHARSKPVQYAALFLFVLLEGVLLVPLVALAISASPGTPGCAALLALVGALAIFGIAMRQREEYRMGAAMALWFVVAAIAAGICCLVFGLENQTYLAAGTAALAGWSVLYNTRSMLEEYPRDRYVAAALELFAAIPLFPWFLFRATFMPRR